MSGSVEKVGTEMVRSIKTTRYKATINLSRVIANMPAHVRGALDALRNTYHLSSLPVQAWIAADGTVRRMSYTIESLSVPGGGTARATTTVEMYDFGVPVSVKAPPAKDTVDFARGLRAKR